MSAREDQPVQPLEEALFWAAREGRSGWLEVRGKGEPAGTIVIHAGQIAWAAATGQPEHLGRFLERLGYLTSDQLREISARHALCKGTRKIGRLLEEAGFVSRPALRLCLLLHVRMAFATLFSQENLLAMWDEGVFCPDDELTFPLSHVLPQWTARPATMPHPGDLAPALLPLGDLPGYRGSVVADWTGHVVARHGFPGPETDAASLLATAAVGILGGPLGLGASEQGFLECEQGTVVARWLGEGRRLIAAVSLDRRGKPGTALHRLAATSSTILHGIGTREVLQPQPV